MRVKPFISISCFMFLSAYAHGDLARNLEHSMSDFSHWVCKDKSKPKRGLASLKSQDPNLNSALTSKTFKAKLKSPKGPSLTVDIDKDGKPDCKREFYKGTNQIKREVCDMNQDGVKDLVSVFDKKGFLKKELVNRDKDKSFEVSVGCTEVTGEPGLIRCKKDVDTTKDNIRNESQVFYQYSPSILAKETRKKLFSKKQSRGIASTKKPRFDESKLPIGHGYDWTLKKEMQRLDKYKSSAEYKRKADKLEAWENEKKDYMKYFMSFEGYIPGAYDGCLSRSRNSCQNDVNYKNIGMEENLSSFTHCMNSSFFYCHDDMGKSEGEHCFNCLDVDKFDEFVDIALGHEIKGRTAPEGFSYMQDSEVLFHDSCKPFVDSATRMVFPSCWTFMDNTPDGSEEYSYENNSKITGLRVIRSIFPEGYSEAVKLLNDSKAKRAGGVPEVWKIKKERFEEEAKMYGVEYLDEKEDPRIKVFCNSERTPQGESTASTASLIAKHQGVLYSPPAIYLEPDKLVEHYKGRVTEREAVNKFIDEEMGHTIAHVLGHTHGYPKQVQKGPNKGKWRCDWSAEPDYSYLCEDKTCDDDRGQTISCAMGPGDHIDPDTGDLIKYYASGLRAINNSVATKWGLVSDPSDCTPN